MHLPTPFVQRAPRRPLSEAQGGKIFVDAKGLARDLKKRIEGEVRFDAGSRALYAADSSNYRHAPIGVVVPRSIDDVVATVATCRDYGAPLLSRGAGTSLAGQCCNVAVVLDWKKYLHRLLDIDPATKTARVQPGIILDRVRKTAEASYQLTVGPEPATHEYCTLGGMIGNNSCGAHAQMNGPMSHNVQELEVLTYDGLRMRVGKTTEEELNAIIRGGGRRAQIYLKLRNLRDRYGDLVRARFPKLERRVSGYNLDALLPENAFDLAQALVGTEGTCVTMLEATVKLIYSPPVRVLLVLGYPDIYQAGDDVPALDRFGLLALEGLDDVLIENLKRKNLHLSYLPLLPEGRGFLMAEFGGETLEEAHDRAHEAAEAIARRPHPPSMKIVTEMDRIAKVWKIRESGLGATARVPGEPDTWEGWEDSAVPPERVGQYLRELRALYDKFGYNCALYGHFGQGCIHTRIDFDLVTNPGIQKFRQFLEEASDLVLSHGGSLSGEHGDGQSRAELLPKMFGEELITAFREFKGIWDPDGKMNPNRIVDAPPITADLRLGADHAPWRPSTYFSFAEDDGSFARATQRCVGVGLCTRVEGAGTMCPSYMVLREEEHTTRGRAHLLFEMFKGGILNDGWRDEHVKESLDLCLACKGCKGDCPVNVDVATYKAEYLAHYFKGRLRPMPAYAMGLIMYWARLAALAPRIANAVTQTDFLSGLAKRAAGIAPERQMPKFAPITFQRWHRDRAANASAAATTTAAPRTRKVVLWPDTFNNHFFPETARAALEVLEDAGFEVVVPQQRVCCGRPLYDFGMLPTARRMLERTLKKVAPYLDAGIPVVGLEPSCVSVFRDEMNALLPHNPRARQMAQQTFLFSEFLEKYAPDYPLPKLEMKATMHGHCHQKSLFKLHDEQEVLKRMGVEVETPETGCCGMAGSFGFEKGQKYEVSQACGERVLLPKVRHTSKYGLVIADGFSCREQIEQNTDRKALHLAQVMRMAMSFGPKGPDTAYPEKGWVTGDVGGLSPRTRRRKQALIAAGVLAGGLAAARVIKAYRAP